VTGSRGDRAALGFLALCCLGALLLAGVLVAVLLPSGRKNERAAPSTTTRPSTTATTAPATTTAPPRTTTAPPTTAPPPAGPLQAVAVGPLSAAVQWTKPNPPAVVGYGLPELGPTMWSPVKGRRAILTGLRYATGYRVWAGDATFDFETAGVPFSPAASIGDGVVKLDGEPFFPLAVVAQCPSGYESSLAAGISLFAGNDCGGIAEQTEGLGGRAFSLTNADEAGTGGAGVIGWYYPDEADLKGLTAATLPRFPTLAETARLRLLTLTNHFYSRAAPLAAGRAIYPGLIARSDVVAFDLYPLQEFCKLDWLPDVAAAQRELVALARGRPTFQWIEAGTWKCHQPQLRVTPATLRAESWLSVIGGARGIGFFPADWDPALTPEITRIAQEVAALGGALLAPEALASATTPVLAAARSLHGALYVVAVNPTRSATRATVTASGLDGRTGTALGEGRSVNASGDAFSDGFAPLAAHLYVFPPS
jgi:hypothetical protein